MKFYAPFILSYSKFIYAINIEDEQLEEQQLLLDEELELEELLDEELDEELELEELLDEQLYVYDKFKLNLFPALPV